MTSTQCSNHISITKCNIINKELQEEYSYYLNADPSFLLNILLSFLFLSFLQIGLYRGTMIKLVDNDLPFQYYEKKQNSLGVVAPYPNSVSVPSSDCNLKPCCILISTLRAPRSLPTPEFFRTTPPKTKFENLSMMVMITYKSIKLY